MRTILTTAAVTLLVTAGLGGLVGAEGHEVTIFGCHHKENGKLRVVATPDACLPEEVAISWNAVGPAGPPGEPGEPGEAGPAGPAGPPGDFTGVFTSPNGEYSIAVADDGISMVGPSGAILLDGSGVTVSGIQVSLDADTLLEASGGSLTEIDGGTIALNGGCAPVARLGDPVSGDPGGGQILDGSSTVLTC